VSLIQHRQLHSHHEEPTIYALSTASGKAAIAVVRVSGPACRQVQLGVSNGLWMCMLTVW
jgi:tRNA modification GTPase